MTESSKGRVGSDAAWALVYSASVRLGTFGISVAIARILGVTGAGAFGVALQVSTLAALAGGLNVAAAVANFLARSNAPAYRRDVLKSSLLLVTAGGTIVGVAIVLSAGVLARTAYQDESLVGVLAASGSLAFATALLVWGEGVVQGLRWFRRFALWGTCVAALDIVLGVPAALGGVPMVLAVRTAVRILAVLALILYLGRVRVDGPLIQLGRDLHLNSEPHSSSPTGSMSRAILRFALPTLASSLVVMAALTVMRLLLVHQSGLEEAGHYQAADTLGQGLAVVPMAAAMAFGPAVAQKHASGEGDLGASLGRALRGIAGFNLPACLLLAGFSTLAVRTVFGQGFHRASDVLILLSVSGAMAGLSTLFGTVFIGRGEVRSGFGLNLAWAAIVLGLFCAVFAQQGASGAAISIAVGYGILLGAQLIIAVLRWRLALLPLAAPLLGSLGSILAVAATSRIPEVGGAIAATLGVILAVAFFALWGWPEIRSGSLRGAWMRGS